MLTKFANWLSTFTLGALIGVAVLLTYLKMYHVCFPNPVANGLHWLF